MSDIEKRENGNTGAAEQTEEKAAEVQEKKTMTPNEAAEAVAKGKLTLVTPIRDGDVEYKELNYDFNALTGWELAQAIDFGADARRRNTGGITDMEALSLFAAAAGKCNGLDARDVRERMGIQDAIMAINAASVFYRGSYLGGLLRITKA